jgi:hypothetical protein
MKNDILNNRSAHFREMPFCTPEGYFEQTKAEIKRQTTAPKVVSLWDRVSPHLSVAAAFIIMLTAGTFILERTSSEDDMTYEDYLVHSDMLISTEYDNESYYAEANMAEEDIVEYLIYTGMSAEAIELSK